MLKQKRNPKLVESNSYLDLLKKTLTRYGMDSEYKKLWGPKRICLSPLQSVLASLGLEIVQKTVLDLKQRKVGLDWPATAETMIGLDRLDNIQNCIYEVVRNKIPGDLIETGTWRGGATIFMRACLKELSVTDRTVWVADSFEGLPKPNIKLYIQDKLDIHWRYEFLAVSLKEVKKNFIKYNLLDKQVKFLKGWFKDTLPTAPIKKLAIMRLDGDMYESTIQALEYLYPKLSVGGYVIIDDYGLGGCRAAVDDFRNKMGIKDRLNVIDWSGRYWKRTK